MSKVRMTYYGKYTKNAKDETWDSGLAIVEPVIWVDPDILRLCDYITTKVDGEFSILTKGSWTDDGFETHLVDGYVIPKQESSIASVEYEEDLTKYKKEGYSVVFHAHPKGVESFSSVDDEHVNCQFPSSILYHDGEFTDAVLSHRIEGRVLVVKAEVRLMEDDFELDVDGLENIKEKTYEQGYPIRGYSNGIYRPERSYYKKEKAGEQENEESLSVDDFNEFIREEFEVAQEFKEEHGVFPPDNYFNSLKKKKDDVL